MRGCCGVRRHEGLSPSNAGARNNHSQLGIKKVFCICKDILIPSGEGQVARPVMRNNGIQRSIKWVPVISILFGLLGIFIFPIGILLVPALYFTADGLASLITAGIIAAPLLALFGGALGEKNPQLGGKLLFLAGAIELGAWFGPVGWVLGPLYAILGLLLVRM